MSDEQLLQFVDAIIYDFPGYVRVTSLTLEKLNDINDGVLLAASRGKELKQASGEIKFLWVGVRTPQAEEKDDAEPAKNVKQRARRR